MAVTTRLLLTLLEQGQSGSEVVLNTDLNTIDGAVAVLALANAFLGNNTFAGTSKFAGFISGNGGPLTKPLFAVTYLEAYYITVNTGTITAPRNFILPTVPGAEWVVTNNQVTHAITFKTAAGTGIAVSSFRRAILTCGNAGNITRVTSENVTSP
jgi:hypothetical protein